MLRLYSKIPPVSGYLYILLPLIMMLLFYVKYTTRQKTRVLLDIEQKIRVEQEAIHTLKAELSYLKSPQNIGKYASESLNLQYLNPDQATIIDLDKKNKTMKYP